MSTMLSFQNNELATSFMSMEDIKKVCPMALKSAPTNPNVSNRYVQANTMTVIEDMSKLGWFPVQAKQCRINNNSNGVRSFHMIALQNPNIKIFKNVTDENGVVTQEVESYPRIILTNSHDGFNSFKFMVGTFRLICSNGLVCGEQMVNMSIRHINYTFEALRMVVENAVKQVPNIVNTMNQMKNVILTDDAKKELATAVYKIRKNIEDDEKVEIKDEVIEDILTPLRKEDEQNDLYHIFNVCQEKMIKGGFVLLNNKNKTRKQRRITSIKKDIDYNQKLWNVARRYLPMAA